VKVQALLCDSVTVRENLLHILGGGISRLWRTEFPTRMGVDLALLLSLHPVEAGEPHRLRFVIQTADGKQIGQLDAELAVESQSGEEPTARRPGESIVIPLAVPLRDVAIEEEGDYSIELVVDNQHVDSLPFSVVPPPEPSGS
jgi:hypothetical protein